MTHETSLDLAAIDQSELSHLRSELLDVFSDVERIVNTLLKSADKLPSPGAQFGARLEALKKVEGIPQIAKANLPKRDRLIKEISQILPVRADVVHSRMKTCIIDGECAAIFVNSANAGEAYPQSRIITLTEFNCLLAAMRRIAKDLSELGRVASPPSSPPPPSQAAADGP